MKDTIKKLVEAWGPSGFEHQVRALIEAEIAGLADEVRTDPVGNLICRIGSGGPKIMIAAHMDEIGMILTYQDEEGFFRFDALGGLVRDTLFGHRVRFENGVTGVIGREGNLMPKNVAELSSFYIDASDGNGHSGIKVGDPAALFRPMEERGSRLIAKSMDDRIGCAVAIESMRRLSQGSGTPNEVYFVFTVQEEVGLRGARPAATGLAPDLGIAVDITPAFDMPRPGSKMPVGLGKGAAIKAYDRGLVVPPAVKNLMVDRAEAAGIPYQIELIVMGSTDAAGISISGAGAPAGCISIPTRYAHTTSETVDINDVNSCVDLLVEIVGKPVDF
jgi:putative aminopeptidase FrvX